MNVKDYIESGILELYVAGALSDKENQDIFEALQKHQELMDEVLKIEASVIKLTSAVKPVDSNTSFQIIKQNIVLGDDKIISITKTKTNWINYSGWAAAVIIGIGLFWMINQNNTLKEDIRVVEIENQLLETQIENSRNNLDKTKHLLSILRDKNISKVSLAGQQVSPTSYADVYWDKNEQTIYLDVKGLPDPPPGKVYQVWSLTLDPLTPTSLGTLDDFITDENKIFAIKNTNNSEAFGITLEPAGGSESPTLEQLYTLGTTSG